MLSQIAVNGLSYGATLALIGIAFSVTYMGARFFTFTFGASYVSAAYVVLALHEVLPLWLCFVAGISVAGLLGAALEALLFGPLRRRNDNPMLLMLVSIGIYTIVENVISLQFGDDTRSFREGLSPTLPLGTASLSQTQALIVAASIFVPMLIFAFLRWSAYGSALRALSSNPSLALIAGLHVERISIVAVALGGTVAGAASCLQALDTDLVPTMGFWALTYGIIASVVAGPRRPLFAAFSGMAIGMISNLAVAWMPSQWQDTIAFTILAVALYVRAGRRKDVLVNDP